VQNAKNRKLHVQNAENIKTACAECSKHKNCMCRNLKTKRLHVQNAKQILKACAEC
jgi:hypothetical protein